MALQGGILERFWELANLDPAKRHSGAKELIGSLVELQQRSEKTAAAGTECCQELTYSVKRLVRGLASSREGARQGYALALTELLHTFPIVTIDSVFKLIDENLIPSNNAKGQEEKDAHFGNLFGLLSIIRSQRLNLIQTTPSAHQQNGHSEKPKKQKKQKKGEEKEETTGGEAADEKEKLAGEVVRRLFELSSKKSFLAEVCHCAISGFLEQLTQRCFETHVLPLFLQHALPEGKKPSELSPESLALAIAFQQRFTFDMRKSCGAPWATGDILQPSNLSPMTHACKESLYVHPKVHSLWDAILAAALPQAADHQKRSPNYDFLVKLWAAIAERHFFTGSHPAKYLGFELFKRIIPHLPAEHVPSLFTKGFLRCLINNLSSAENFLHDAAKNVLPIMTTAAEKDMQVRLAIVLQLTGANGNKQFDTITKTHTVRQLLNGLNSEGVQQFTAHLQDIFLTAGGTKTNNKMEIEEEEEEEEKQQEDTEKKIDGIRLWALDQMGNLLRNSSILYNRDEEWLLRMLRFLMFHAFFFRKLSGESNASNQQAKKKKKTKAKKGNASSSVEEDLKRLEDWGVGTRPEPELSPRVRHACSKAFYSLLRHLGSSSSSNGDDTSNQRSETTKKRTPSTAEGAMNNGELWIWRVTNVQNEMESMASSSSVISLLPRSLRSDEGEEEGAVPLLSEEAKESRAKMLRIVKHIHAERLKNKKSGKRGTSGALKGQWRAFELLFLHVGLQLYVDGEEGVEVLDELIECWERVNAVTSSSTTKNKSQDKKSKKANDDKMEEEEDGEEASEDEDDEEEEEPESILVLVDILVSLLAKPSSLLRDIVGTVFRAFCSQLNARALKVLVDVIVAKKEDALFEEGGDDESQAPSKEKMKQIKEALGRHVIDEEDEDEVEEVVGSDLDDEQEEEEEELMGDDEMFKMDEKLAEIFKHMKEQKSAEKGMAQDILHFRCRVVDLLDIYVRKEGANPLVLRLLTPLATAIKDTSGLREMKALHDKLCSLVGNKLARSKDYPKGKDLPLKRLQSALRVYVDAAIRAPSVPLPPLTSTIFYILKVLLASSSSNEQQQQITERVVTIMTPMIHDFMTRKNSRLSPSFFEELIKRFPLLSWTLLPKILSYTYAPPRWTDASVVTAKPIAKNEFTKAHAFQFLSSLLRQQQHLGEGASNLMEVLPTVLLACIVALKEGAAALRQQQGEENTNADGDDDKKQKKGNSNNKTQKKKQTMRRVVSVLQSVKQLALTLKQHSGLPVMQVRELFLKYHEEQKQEEEMKEDKKQKEKGEEKDDEKKNKKNQKGGNKQQVVKSREPVKEGDFKEALETIVRANVSSQAVRNHCLRIFEALELPLLTTSSSATSSMMVVASSSAPSPSSQTRKRKRGGEKEEAKEGEPKKEQKEKKDKPQGKKAAQQQKQQKQTAANQERNRKKPRKENPPQHQPNKKQNQNPKPKKQNKNNKNQQQQKNSKNSA